MAEVTIEQTPAQGSFTLTAGLMHALRQEAARRGMTLSELVREILTEALAARVAV